MNDPKMSGHPITRNLSSLFILVLIVTPGFYIFEVSSSETLQFNLMKMTQNISASLRKLLKSVQSI